MRGAWRAAMLKSAMQKAVEAQAQEISKIAIGLNATFISATINISHQPTQHGCRPVSGCRTFAIHSPIDAAIIALWRGPAN
jgi:hypothetical protein